MKLSTTAAVEYSTQVPTKKVTLELANYFKLNKQLEQLQLMLTCLSLDGLSELSLGGIQVGGSAVVIKEFSKDGTFIANSNNIVPTQAAIISYLAK